MTTATKAFCMSCVLDREVDAQTGRCLTCGHQVVKPSTEPTLERNAGVPARSPSQAYRAPSTTPGEVAREAEYERRRVPISAPFDSTRSVAKAQAEVAYTPSPQTKVCTACGQDKPLDKFYAQGANRPGLMTRCKDCHNGKRPVVAEKTEQPAPAPVTQDSPASEPPTPKQDARPPAGDANPAVPAGTPSAAWLAEAHALADGFEARARDAEQRAEAALAEGARYQAEAKALRKSGAVFTRLLGEVPVS